MKTEWILVDTPKKVKQVSENFENSSVLSIDTEYDSFRYFREKLCLIQIHSNDSSFIFDPLLDVNLDFLGNFFNNKKIIKVFHAADNDIRLLKRDYGFEFTNIFDTHRAAFLLGFHQLSLEKMILEFLDVELKKNKKIQRSRWDKRPLSDEQLFYAMQDVTYLPALYEKQLKKLREKKLEAAATETFIKIAATAWQEKTLDRRGHTRINGYYALNQNQKDLLKKLYVWRFSRAKKENCAIFMFLPDDELMTLVQNDINFQEFSSPSKSKSYYVEIEQLIKEHTKQYS